MTEALVLQKEENRYRLKVFEALGAEAFFTARPLDMAFESPGRRRRSLLQVSTSGILSALPRCTATVSLSSAAGTRGPASKAAGQPFRIPMPW